MHPQLKPQPLQPFTLLPNRLRPDERIDGQVLLALHYRRVVVRDHWRVGCGGDGPREPSHSKRLLRRQFQLLP